MVRDAYERNTDRDVFTKASSVDLVTETDCNVESLLINGLSSKFPNHRFTFLSTTYITESNNFFRFIGEESVVSGKKIELTDDPTWIIDPIDGTTNFVHRYMSQL